MNEIEKITQSFGSELSSIKSLGLKPGDEGYITGLFAKHASKISSELSRLREENDTLRQENQMMKLTIEKLSIEPYTIRTIGGDENHNC